MYTPEGFVLVKGDTIVGSEDSNNFPSVFKEGRTVTLSDFYISKYEITQEQYASVMNGQVLDFEGDICDLELYPSACVKNSVEYTLFEGELGYEFDFNSGLDSVGWYNRNNATGITDDSVNAESVKGSHQVGKKTPNRLGIYDMSGNVSEWCYDWE